MILIEGSVIAERIRNELAFKVKTLATPPCLAVVLVGEDPAGKVYVAGKEKAATLAGFRSRIIRLPQDSKEGELLALIAELNEDKDVNGILVQLPLPPSIDPHKLITAIDPSKDVDGFHPQNVGLLNIGEPRLVPCTPLGVMRLLAEYNIPVEGKRAVIVGRSDIVGKPLASLLLAQNATVTLCHSKTVRLPEVCREADILVAAIGRAKYIGPEFVKEGAVVIDVGINREGGKLCGDVDFDAVAERASAITPVPKGVGPMTVAMLLENTLKTVVLQEKRRATINSELPDRDTVIVISDIHLGDERALEQNYAWFNKNKVSLTAFLSSLKKRGDIKTLIIAGDLFDEWVAPIDVSAYSEGQSHSDFILSIKKANKEVIEALVRLKTESGINIYYVNGNHDLLVTARDIEAVFGKGIVFYCDDFFNAENGIGTFYDADLKLIVEHGHRYDFFNAPYKQIVKDKSGAQRVSILPPGFFVAKLSTKTRPKLENSQIGDMHQFLYAITWTFLLDFLSIKDYKNKDIRTGIGGLEENYSVEDVAPYLKNGVIVDKRTLFKEIEQEWEKTQKANGIDGIRQPFIALLRAILADGVTLYLDEMAKSQYFDNAKMDTRIVVFGHSHDARLISYYTEEPSKKSIYANSGTWIDSSKTSRNYVVIKRDKKAEKIFVSVCQIDEKENVTTLGEDSISIPQT